MARLSILIRSWSLTAATQPSIIIDLETEQVVQQLPQPTRENALAACRAAATRLLVDFGRPVTLRFENSEEVIGTEIMDLTPFLSQLTGRFTSDHRTGIPGTLHRISALTNTSDKVVGLTYRVGRHVAGCSGMLTDVLTNLTLQNYSLLLLGPPGVGKTTLLRDVAAQLSETKRVVVVDTSLEIGGPDDIPHTGLGARIRRAQVKHREAQYLTMLETVQNHNPQVLVIDEIGHSREVDAARTIAQRGVSLVATAHGTDFSSILSNPDLVPLVGGVQPVLLGDAEARAYATKTKQDMKKTILERKGKPTFDILVEVLGNGRIRIYHNVAATVDAKLAARNATSELRWQCQNQLFARHEHGVEYTGPWIIQQLLQ